MGSQALSSQSPPGFRSTALALPLSPGRSKGKPKSFTNPETQMPIAFAPLLPPNPFRIAPAIHPAPAPVPPLPDDKPRPSFRNSTPDHPLALVPLSPCVLVKLCWGFLGLSAWGSALSLNALKALSPSVLVKRVVLTFVRCAPAIDQRLGGQCCAGAGNEKLVPGVREALTGGHEQTGQGALVKSFSSPCRVPLTLLCNPGTRSALNGLGASHA